MQRRSAPILIAMLIVAGCTAPVPEEVSAPVDVNRIPDNVAALAAPEQDLSTARLRPEDGCYWYEHSGPVETTLVPLRSPGGNPICAAAQPS